MAGKKTGKRLLTWVLVLVMALSLLPLNVLASGEGGSPHEDVVNGYYDASGTWKQGASSAQPDVPGIVSVSKTAARAANTNPEDNTYDVTLRVETEGIKDTNKAATVLVIDTSASMDECMKEEHTHNEDCYTFTGQECTPDSNPSHWRHIGNYPYHKPKVKCNYDRKTGNYYITDEKVRICDKEEHSHRDGNCYTRLDAAKKAAIDFLDSYRNGAQSGSGRYVALVAFNKTASNSTAWTDVSSSADYTAAKLWINGLSADGGTNLDAGLSVAGTKFNESPVSSIAAENRNIIVLTDGEPTYCLDSDGNVYGLGSFSTSEILTATNATAKKIRDDVCPIHTICFAAGNEKIHTIAFGSITLSEYLETYIASDGKAYNASSYDELTDAFSAISDIITSHLTEAVVHDSLPTGVTAADSTLFNSNGAVAWNLFEDFEKEETAGGTTVYTKTYTVKIDPETAGKADGEYCPLNGQTTLTVKSQRTPNGATLPFPIPAGLVTVPSTPDPEPTEPSKEEVKKLLGDNAVQIICTNGESNHGDKAFGLIDDTFSIVHSGYNCEVKIDSFNEYVEKFNTELDVAQGTHISDASKTSKEQSIINLKWKDGAWTAVDAPAKHHVLCVTPKYTVTYTDGVDGEEVFADQVHNDLLSGTATPTFNGTPTRTDYVFAGWKPAVAEKVTENATYAAQWKEDKNHNGIADDEEDKYTVTYTDGVDGEEVFADQVYDNLLSGTATPAFNGTPTRNGYVFAGWNPAVARTVTGNATYVAQWTARTDLSYTVHYYLKNTTKKVADDKTVDGQTFNADVTENAIRISGYRVYGDSEKSITIGTGTNEIIFYYTRASRPSTPSKPTLNTGDHYAYVMGYPDGTVRPNGSITRAEVSAILFRLLSDKTRDEYFTTESSFTDVKAGAWYNNSIATLEKAGVIVDTAKGDAFRPNEAITRAELAAMLAQFSDAKPVKGVKFSDVPAEHWAYEAIAIAAKMGWIEGYPDGTFRPDATITRAEMMTLVNRALERVPSDEDHLLSKRVMLTFPDCKSGDWFYIAVQEATNSHTYERAATEKNGDEQWTALRANRDWTLLEK